jgi:hypothetical protein
MCVLLSNALCIGIQHPESQLVNVPVSGTSDTFVGSRPGREREVAGGRRLPGGQRRLCGSGGVIARSSSTSPVARASFRRIGSSACLRRNDGSTPVVPGARRQRPPGTRSAASRPTSAAGPPMRGGCTTCMATSTSGAATGITGNRPAGLTPTCMPQRTQPPEASMATSPAHVAVAAGPMTAGRWGQPFVCASTRTAATTTSGFGSWRLRWLRGITLPSQAGGNDIPQLSSRSLISDGFAIDEAARWLQKTLPDTAQPAPGSLDGIRSLQDCAIAKHHTCAAPASHRAQVRNPGFGYVGKSAKLGLLRWAPPRSPVTPDGALGRSRPIAAKCRERNRLAASAPAGHRGAVDPQGGACRSRIAQGLATA